MKRWPRVCRAPREARIGRPLAVASGLLACLGLVTALGVGGTAANAVPVTVAAAAGGSSVALSGSPGYPPSVNPATHTLYVPIQCANPSSNATCAATATDVLEIINTATCTPARTSHCRVVASARVGRQPIMALVDESTDTIYVPNQVSNTVTVINGATCNATVTRGCGRPVATIKLRGKFPVAAAIDDKTHTLYVGNSDSFNISVINIAKCDARTAAGCGQAARLISDRGDPSGVAVDLASDTVYVTNASQSGNGDTVSVFNGATCNGSTGHGCGARPHTITVGSGPFWDDVDQTTDTVYTANYNDGTVSVINGATCNATVTSGCGRTAVAVPTGAGETYLAVDPALHTVFAINQEDGTISAIDTRTCNGSHTSGCASRALNVQASFNPPSGYNANAFALNPQTGVIYLVNSGGEPFLEAMSITGCNAVNHSTCRAEARTVADPELFYTVDPSTGTIYAGDLAAPQIDVINGATCRAKDVAHCAPVATIPTPDPGANVGAIDEATHTLYAGDESASGTLLVINTATCNAIHTAGCSAKPPTMKIGAYPNPPAVNPATGTVYVSYGDDANQIAVVDAATCDATDTSGCGGHPEAVAGVGAGTGFLAVSVATNTVYGAVSGNVNGFDGDTVAVLNGATCDAASTAGCGHLTAQVKVGEGPTGIVADDATHTVYVVNNANGDLPGTVSLINSATCNGTDTAGCGHRYPVMPTGRSPLDIALDPVTGALYVSDFSSAEVTVLDGATCNVTVTGGCGREPAEQPVGSQPFGVAVNPATGTVYVSDLFAGLTSLFAAIR